MMFLLITILSLPTLGDKMVDKKESIIKELIFLMTAFVLVFVLVYYLKSGGNITFGRYPYANYDSAVNFHNKISGILWVIVVLYSIGTIGLTLLDQLKFNRIEKRGEK